MTDFLRYSPREYLSEKVDIAYPLLTVFTTLACIVYLCLRSDTNVEARKENGSRSQAQLQEDSLQKCNFSDVIVTKILVHPIKSCRGTAVTEARYTEEGLEFDRKLAIIDATTCNVLTAREYPKMILICPRMVADSDGLNGGRLEVSFPSGSGCEAFSVPLNPSEQILRNWTRIEELTMFGHNDLDGYICQSINADDRDAPARTLTRYFGHDVLLVFKGPRPRPCPPTTDFPELKASAKYQDEYPLLVMSEESLRAVQDRMRGEVGNQGVADRWKEDDLVMERFRPNIVLNGAGKPWVEDIWQTVRVGENTSTISLVSKCTRCLLPNVDPDTGIRDKAVPYKVLMKFRTGKNPARPMKPCLGCNGVPSGHGTVRVGDAVEVLKLSSGL